MTMCERKRMKKWLEGSELFLDLATILDYNGFNLDIDTSDGTIKVKNRFNFIIAEFRHARTSLKAESGYIESYDLNDIVICFNDLESCVNHVNEMRRKRRFRFWKWAR